MAFQGQGLRNVLLVSEKKWHNEHYMMDRLLGRSGALDRSYFYYTDLWSGNLLEEIRAKNITTVVGLGEPVLRKLLGEKDILRWRGRVVDWMGIHFIPTFAPHKLLPENPNAEAVKRARMEGIQLLSKPPRFQGTWMLDVGYALHVAKQGFQRKQAAYTVDPSPSEFDAWADGYFAALAADPDLYLSWDVETVYKQKKANEDEFEEDKLDLAEGTLLRISFSYQEYTGISVPWEPAYLGTIRRLLAASGPKVVWNGITFDVPVVEAVGVKVGGEVFDYMDGWHVYQSDLPKGLEYVTSYTSDLLPWKHLNNSDPGLYSAIDADAALRNANWIRAKLKAAGQWELYHNLYVRLAPILTTANNRGNYIDVAKRDELKAEMSALIQQKIADLQPMVPREIKPRKVWLNPPVEGFPKYTIEISGNTTGLVVQHAERDFDQVVVPEALPMCSICGQVVTNKAEHFKGSKGEPTLDKKGNVRLNKKGEVIYARIKNACKVAGGQVEERPGFRFEYHEVEDFNPNSTQQLIEYARHFNHPIGTNKDDHEKEAFDANHIKELLLDLKEDDPHHVFYSKVLEIKKLAKTLGTYIYEPDANNLIHQTYKNAPSTPRLSGANYNLMNVGKREENYWAVRAREQIIARPGYRFVQADSSAIEAVIQGYLMGDRTYMELATQSVHAWVVAQKYGIEWTGTVENVDYIKKHFKDEYNKMKTANYLTNFGGSSYLMWKTDRKSFPTQRSAQETQDELYGRLPKLKTYHHTQRTRAQKEGYLVIPGWNYRHYYYDVFTTDPRTGKLKLGHDAKRVVALGPQGSAALFGRENMLLLGYGDQAAEWLGIEPLGLGDGYRDWLPANLFVHDGYTLEVPDGAEDEAAAVLERILTRPIKQLGGLRVGCEVDISPVMGNWGTYHEVKNPNGLKTIKTVRVPLIELEKNAA